MQRRRDRCGSSGELGVFGATRYFDDSGLADLAAGRPVAVTAPHQDLTMREKVTAPHHQDLRIQVKIAPDMKHTEEESRSSAQEPGAKAAKSNLATFFCSLVSRASSFCDNPPAISGRRNELPPPAIPPPTPCSRACGDTITAAADLGVVVGDRRLQGVRVVSGGDEARWVVRCGGHALEEEHSDSASSDHGHQAVQGAEDGDDRGWDSDSSSDLFELDLENACTHNIDRRSILSSPGLKLASISE